MITSPQQTVQRYPNHFTTLLPILFTIGLVLFNLSLSFGQTFKWETPRDKGAAPKESVAGKSGSAAKADKNIKDSSNPKTGYRIKTIVIDAGHGGHDPGCLGPQTREKNIALAIALKLADNVRQQFPSVKVILTRDSDVFIPLYERAEIANRNNADLFMSIHCNFMPGRTDAKGSETYVMGLHTAAHNLDVAKRENAVILLEDNYRQNYDYDPNSPEGHILFSMFQNAYLDQSISLADKIESKISSDAGRSSRGVKQAGFVVLKETAMPSVLVEAGFLSNPQEEAFLNTDEGQQYMADALLLAFAEYKQTMEGGDAQPILTAEKTTLVDRSSGVDQFAKTQKTIPINTTPVQTAPPPPAPKSYSDSQPIAASNNNNSTARRESKIIPYSYETPVTPTQPVANTTNTWTAKSPGPGFDDDASVSDIVFCVQLAASAQPIDTRQSRWREAGYLIEVVQEGNMYKYQARNFSNYEEALQARIQLQTSGFADAFIVAYQRGERITLEQARKVMGQ